jgi:ATP-dependent helicase/nuclease subunit B
MPALRIFPDADRVEQALVEAATAHAFVDATGYVSIAWLVEACEPARWLKRSPVSPLAARLLMAAAARALGPNAFGDYAREPAFARSAWELVQQLKLQDTGPADLEAAIAGLGHPPRPRLECLAKLWRAYEDLLSAQQLADRGDLLRAAADRLAKELPSRLEHFTQVEVHHLHDLPPARARLLQSLATTCHARKLPVKVTLPAANNPQIDVLVNEAFAGMEKAWQGLDVDAWPEVPNAPLAWIGGSLFGDNIPPQTAPNLHAFSAATPRDEARQIAHRVRKLLDEGAAPEQVAIVFRDLGDDAEAMVEALEEVGVPARVRLGMPLGATAPGRLALLLPQLVDDGFPVDGVLAVLESRYAPKVSKQAPDAAQWFGLAALRDNVLGGDGKRGAFEVRLGALAERLEDRDAKEVRRLADRVATLIKSGKLLGETATALEYLAGWQKMLEALGLTEGLQGHESRESEGTALGRAVERALARDQAAGEALISFFDVLHEALVASGVGAHTISRRDFVRLLGDAARDINLQARGPRSGSVRVLDVRAIAGLKFSHVFIGGLVDGRFPGRPSPLALVTEDERGALNAIRPRLFRLGVGDGELSLPLRQAEDRLLFHLGLCAGSSVTLSRARSDAGGRELIASPFIDELRRVVPGFVDHPVPRSAVLPLDTVRSAADFRARVALEALSPSTSRLSRGSPLGSTFLRRLSDEPWMQHAASISKMETERLRFFTSPDLEAGPFSGDLSSAAFDAARRKWFAFDNASGLSVSALGRYGNCAFAGILSQLLRLEAVEEQGEEPDARTRGTFWHLVFEQLMPQMKAHGWLGKPVSSLPTAELDALIDQAIDQAAKKAETDNAVGHPALWKLGREKARRMVQRVLFSENEGQPFKDQQWLPDAVEVTFGRGATDERFRTVVAPAARPGEQDVFLNGKIDRIDLGPGGAGVVDYKAGRKKKNAKAELLVSDFQLPAYVLALRQALMLPKNDAAWLYLGDHDASSLSRLLGKDQTLDELMAVDLETRDRVATEEKKKNFANAVHEVAGQLRAGDVGARPHDCQWCSFKRVCRISQRRIAEELG